MPDLSTQPIDSVQHFKGTDFPADIRFRQILVTGPPGAGKSTLIMHLGGWSEEGYLDLARKHWWRSEVLSVRPREIHLGIPFQGLPNAVSVFDAEFLECDPFPPIDFARVVLPPRKRYFFLGRLVSPLCVRVPAASPGTGPGTSYGTGAP